MNLVYNNIEPKYRLNSLIIEAVKSRLLSKGGINIDKLSFCNLIPNYENEMYRICKSILLSEKDCCDVIQTTLLKAYKNLNSLKDSRYFKTWLFRILINECSNMRKHQKRVIETDDSILNAIADNAEDYRDLYMAIDKLTEKYRQLIILHYLNGYSIEELSELLSIPAGTVKSRLYTARNKLKREYEEVNFA